jgi:hypothetical protein
MGETKWQFSHLLVRLIATVNLGGFALATVFPRYSSAVFNGQYGGITAKWLIVSSLLLPVYVAFEAWWMRKNKIESRALWIDVVFAVGWFAALWGAVLYGFGHYVSI